MKQRILTGWTIQRALFLIMGIIVIVQSVSQKQWIGVGLGSYFAAMGLFSFGCASGGCFGGNCNTEPEQKYKNNIQDIEFKEVKER